MSHQNVTAPDILKGYKMCTGKNAGYVPFSTVTGSTYLHAPVNANGGTKATMKQVHLGKTFGCGTQGSSMARGGGPCCLINVKCEACTHVFVSTVFIVSALAFLLHQNVTLTTAVEPSTSRSLLANFSPTTSAYVEAPSKPKHQSMQSSSVAHSHEGRTGMQHLRSM